MKRVLSFILVLSLLLSISVVSFADNNIASTVSIQRAAPSDFHFDHTETGSTRVDALTTDLTTATVCFLCGPIPGANVACFTIALTQILGNYYSTQRTLSGSYIKYVYVPDDRGDYPACEAWVYVEYYADANRDSHSELIGTESYFETIVLPK